MLSAGTLASTAPQAGRSSSTASRVNASADGVIASLGHVGRNVGAGMSGGLLYVYDPEGRGLEMHNDNVRNVFRVVTPAAEAQLKGLIEKHQENTGSVRAADILRDWPEALSHFWQVAPPSVQQSELVAQAEATVTKEVVSQAALPLVAAAALPTKQ